MVKINAKTIFAIFRLSNWNQNVFGVFSNLNHIPTPKNFIHLWNSQLTGFFEELLVTLLSNFNNFLWNSSEPLAFLATISWGVSKSVWVWHVLTPGLTFTVCSTKFLGRLEDNSQSSWLDMFFGKLLECGTFMCLRVSWKSTSKGALLQSLSLDKTLSKLLQ